MKLDSCIRRKKELGGSERVYEVMKTCISYTPKKKLVHRSTREAAKVVRLVASPICECVDIDVLGTGPRNMLY